MDDFDHSVQLAEQDWDWFLTDSEDCWVQQAQLATIDECSFSEDETTFIHVPSLDCSASGKQLCDNVCEGGQKLQLGVCQIKESPEDSEIPENASLDSKKISKVSEEEDEMNILKLKGNEENQQKGVNEPNQGCAEPMNEIPSADKKHEIDVFGVGKLKEKMGGSPVVTKEKERWFVTVNETPVRLRVKRRKKSSKNLCKSIGSRRCPSSNENQEMTDKQTKKKSEQENLSLDFPTENKPRFDVKSVASPVSSEDDDNRTLCDFSLKEESIMDPPIANSETSPGDHPNSVLNHKEMQQTLIKDHTASPYWNHESTLYEEYDKSIEDIDCEHQSSNDLLSQLANDAGTPKFILGTYTPKTTDEDKTEQLEPSEHGEESSQKTHIISDQTSGPTPPIFAMSSFWDEMEKLTINDILHLRSSNNKSLIQESIEEESIDPSLLPRSEVEIKDESLEDSLVDDTSDYYTHVDDSKPDRSSCDFSTFSDFDEEFVQRIAPSATPVPNEDKEEEKVFESTCLVDSEEPWRGESSEIVKLLSEGDPFVNQLSETEIMDNLLTNEDIRTSTFLLEKCGIGQSKPLPVLSASDILDDQSLMSFEMLSDQFQTWIPLPFSQIQSLAETYDDFFSDFEVRCFVLPSTHGATKSEKSLLPIYSSSHSVVNDQVIPSVGPCILCSNVSETSSIGFFTSQKRAWRYLSLRRTRLLMGRTWWNLACSWGFPTIYDYGDKSSRSSITQSNTLLENGTLNQTMNHENVGARADSNRFLFSLKQADMCLVCIAFASWVVKSSNTQSTDMWKAVLLANVSTISAIQYLRRCIKEG